MSLFSNNSFGALEQALTGLNKRHQAIANNIANMDTPGYKRKFVTFKDQLAQAINQSEELAVTDKQHISVSSRNISAINPKVETEKETTIRNDGNNVNVDTEMANLAKNTIEYQAAMKKLSNQFARLETAIKKGGQG